MKSYFKNKVDDFQVTENMLSEFNNEVTEYRVYTLVKCGISTFDAIQYISEKLKISKYDIGYAGLKDEDGITEQQISIKNNKIEYNYYFKVKSQFDKHSYIKLIYKGFRKEPIKIGELIGNSFRIVLRNLEKKEVERITYEKKKIFYFINYYGIQRFGLPNNPKVAHLIGENLINENYKKAYEYLKISNNKFDNGYLNKEVFDIMDCRKLSFFKTSYESYKWNDKINKIIEKNYIFNEAVRENIKYNFVKSQKDIIDIGKSNQFIEFKKFKADKTIEISSRPVIIQTLITSSEGYEKDDLYDNKYKCEIEFSLPSGVYATVMMEQFLYNILNKL